MLLAPVSTVPPNAATPVPPVNVTELLSATGDANTKPAADVMLAASTIPAPPIETRPVPETTIASSTVTLPPATVSKTLGLSVTVLPEVR